MDYYCFSNLVGNRPLVEGKTVPVMQTNQHLQHIAFKCVPLSRSGAVARSHHGYKLGKCQNSFLAQVVHRSHFRRCNGRAEPGGRNWNCLFQECQIFRL